MLAKRALFGGIFFAIGLLLLPGDAEALVTDCKTIKVVPHEVVYGEKTTISGSECDGAPGDEVYIAVWADDKEYETQVALETGNVVSLSLDTGATLIAPKPGQAFKEYSIFVANVDPRDFATLRVLNAGIPTPTSVPTASCDGFVINPTSVRQDELVTFAGSGCPPGAIVSNFLIQGGPSSYAWPGSWRVSTTGEFSVNFDTALPGSPEKVQPGTYEVRVIINGREWNPGKTFEVSAALPTNTAIPTPRKATSLPGRHVGGPPRCTAEVPGAVCRENKCVGSERQVNEAPPEHCAKAGQVCCVPSNVCFDNETYVATFNACFSAGDFLNTVLAWLLVAAALLALFRLTMGGVGYIFSRGQPDRLEAAQATMTGAIFGLILVFIAWLLIQFVGGNTPEWWKIDFFSVGGG